MIFHKKRVKIELVFRPAVNKEVGCDFADPDCFNEKQVLGWSAEKRGG